MKKSTSGTVKLILAGFALRSKFRHVRIILPMKITEDLKFLLHLPYVTRLKKIVIVLFLVGILNPTGLFKIILSTPDLIEHYHCHKNLTEGLSFSDFFFEHLAENQQEQDEDHDHGDFPFHHNHSNSCCSVLLTFLPSNSSPDFSHPIVETEEKIKISTQKQFRNSEFSCSIWQPPRLI